jgi:hypothetical protein
MNFLRRTLISRPLAAGIVITLVTVALVGSILLTSTSIGCGPAQKVGLKLQRCGTPVAATLSPSPSNPTAPSPYQQPSPNPYSNPASEPNPNPPSNPYPNPPSNPYPNPPSSAYPPPASGAYPPFYPAASSPGQPGPYTVSCRLPIYSGQSGSGGFLVFPGGTYVSDPSSAVLVPSPSPGGASPSPQQGPGGPGNFFGLSYDRKYSRWLAVPFTWITPDGTKYAFPSGNAVYVQDLASGTLTTLGQGHLWSIVGVWSTGVYAVQPNAPGLWLLPFSGAATELVNTGWWQAVSAGAAYGTSTSAVPQGVANTILRYDLKTGATVDWFTRDGAQSTVMGFAANGDPVLSVYYSNYGTELWSTTGANGGVPILSSQYEGLSTNGNVIGDANGIWLPLYYQYGYGNNQQMALYVPGKGLFGMSSITGAIAGACL